MRTWFDLVPDFIFFPNELDTRDPPAPQPHLRRLLRFALAFAEGAHLAG